MAVNFDTATSLPDLSALDGSNGFRARGLEPSALAGNDVATTEDFNGDGINDVIVGARDQFGSDGTSFVGFAHVMFGQNGRFPASVDLSSLNGTNGLSIEGLGATAVFGSALDGAGDVNADGLSDLIVTSVRGQTYVVYGDDSTQQGTLSIEDLNRNSGFNIVPRADQVAGVGDIDGDGVDDIVGGDTFFQNRAGAAYTVFGDEGFVGPSGVRLDTGESTIRGVTSDDLDGSTGFLLREQDGDQDNLGESIDGLGDVNGDGINDFVVSEGDNQAYVIFGQPGGFPADLDTGDLNGDNGFVIEGDLSELDLNDATVSGIGDFNGDGLNDIGMAAPDQGDGKVFVIFGSDDGFGETIDPTLLTSDQGFTIDPTDEFDLGFGSALSGGGDFNNDGLSDLAIGQSRARTDGLANGRAFVVFGNRDSVPADAQLDDLVESNGTAVNGDVSNGFFGASLDLTGDVNGDGADDLIVGQPGEDVEGGASVFFGESDNQSPTANDDQVQTDAGESVTIEVLSNDTDADGDVLRLDQISPANNGTANPAPEQQIRYTPDPGFTGTDTFTYTVTDDNGGTASAQVAVTVSSSEPADPTNVILGAGSGFAVANSGSQVRVFNAADDEVVRVAEGAVVDLSGFQGDAADAVEIAGAASGFQASRSGSEVTLTDGATTVVLDAGLATALRFADTTIELTASQQGVLLGDQPVASTITDVTDPGSGQGHDGFASELATTGERTNVVLGEGASFTLQRGTQNARVLNADGNETVRVGTASDVDLSGFQGGAGDTIQLANPADSYEVSRDGGRVTFSDGQTTVRVDAGLATTFEFQDTALDLRVNTSAGVVELGDQEVGANPAAITASGSGSGHGNANIPGASAGVNQSVESLVSPFDAGDQVYALSDDAGAANASDPLKIDDFGSDNADTLTINNADTVAFSSPGNDIQIETTAGQSTGVITLVGVNTGGDVAFDEASAETILGYDAFTIA